MDITFNQVIIDNNGGTIYYDGGSMGGGVIDFECPKCNSRIKKETFYFFTDQKELQQYKQKLNDYFKIPKVKSIGDNSLAGLLQCNACEQQYALYIKYGEVSNGHWQSELLKVVSCST